MPLTPAQKEAYARANTSTVHLWALEFRHPTFTAPIRLVQHKDNISLTLEASAPVDAGTLQEFTGLAFELQEPTNDTDPDNSLSMQVDGVNGAVLPLLTLANQSYIPIDCTLRAFSYEVVTQTPGELLAILHLQVRHMSVNKTSLGVQLGYTNAANRKFPFIDYTANSNPGLL